VRKRIVRGRCRNAHRARRRLQPAGRRTDDAVALIAAFARVARQLDETLQLPEQPAGASGNLVVSAGIRGAESRAGIAMDVANIAKFFKAMTPR
jgi:hypothetical protein